ncbi:hypothetical protein [Streptomyces hokutonensis]|uniref:hypothetical protein n=1 Tax=Streptomyces hokutonensis TaxID=1306990 RepID=UPI00380AA090
MDKPLGLGYRCQYIRSVGRGSDKREVALSYQIVGSPLDGLRWLYHALRSLPVTGKGDFFERRGWLGMREDFRAAVITMQLGDDWTMAFLTEDGQVQLTVSEVPMLPVVPAVVPDGRP